YSGGFLAAVDGLRGLLGCAGRVWPVSIEQSSLCAEYSDGKRTRGEVEVDAGQAGGHGVTRLWLEPEVQILPAAADAIAQFDAALIGPGSFYTSLMPIFLVKGAAEAVRRVTGPIVLVTNLLTEGRGMQGFTAGHAVRTLEQTIGRPIDVVIVSASRRRPDTLERYADEHKAPLGIGDVPGECEVVRGEFWCGEIARHDRRRLAQAVWAVLARRLRGPGAGCRLPVAGWQLPVAGWQLPVAGSRFTVHGKPLTVNRRSSVVGRRTSDIGHRTSVIGHRSGWRMQ